MEREKEAEEQLGLGHEHVIAGELTVRPGAMLEDGEETKEVDDEVGIATRKTVETVKAVSSLGLKYVKQISSSINVFRPRELWKPQNCTKVKTKNMQSMKH